MRIFSETLDYNIFGTDIPMRSYVTDQFPLRVSLIEGPAKPMEIAVANYRTCIEGRMVYPQEITNPAKDFQWILNGGHSPSLECIHLGFAVEHASVVLLKQISRHRIGNSLGVMTQRANAEEWLGKLAANSHFVVPPSFRGHPDVEEKYCELMWQAQIFYNMAIASGIQQDEARYGIPQGAETMWQGTYSYKTLMDSICSTRMCHVMQGEIVALSHLMAEAVGDYNLIMGSALKPICMKIGRCNRNENNPTDEHPKGVCKFTKEGVVPVRPRDDTMDLTKYSKDALA
jgi:thymidylate synthase (FAD)